MNEIFSAVKTASRKIALLSDNKRNEVLRAVADAIITHQESLLQANAKDLERMSPENPLYDRLQLTTKRLEGIASDIRNVSTLPSPLGHVSKERTLPNGLHLHRVSVPFGVIGIIYEARPNVTFDVFSLCFKSGNACVLKGGRDADFSNQAAISLIHDVLKQHDIPTDAVALLPATHEAAMQLLNARGYVDLCIPRGGRKLIDFVRDTARIPVIETGAGVVNTYFDKDGDTEMGKRIINVIIYADEPAYQSLRGHYSIELLQHATDDSFGTEFMDYKMAIRTVSSVEEALQHIDLYGSGHSECIITDSESTARAFQSQVDAACVYWNAPTSFTDGAQFGLGAEIGISTQKLGARGPMALEEITTYKWLIEGDGQIRAK